LTDKSKNIWYYADRYTPFIDEPDRLTLNEGGVRSIEISELNRELSSGSNIRRFIFKREDENPTGSHKSRSLAYQVSYYKSKGHKTLIISSSGNAAMSAAAYCSLAGIKLIAFVDKTTDKAKVNEIKSTGQAIMFSAKPINFAKYASRKFDIPNLRPSHDDLSVEPYKSIAFELYDEFKDEVDAVFMFPTSASSLIGVAKGYIQLRDELGLLAHPPKVVAVQTGSITSIAKQFGVSSDISEESRAGRLGVKVTRRTKEAVAHIKKLNGTALTVTTDEIEKAHGILNRYGIVTSMEGCATLAGAIKMPEIENIVCILSGKAYAITEHDVLGNEYFAESYTDVVDIVGKIR